MAKTKISEYSSTANSNTDIASINIDENCAPSGINNAIRALMAQLKDWQSGAQDVYITPAGSVSAPAVTTNGDTNTGVYFPAADAIGITTGGTERVRVNSSGNVGIGTSSPADKLEVAGAIRVSGSGSATADNAQFYNASGFGPTINGYNFAIRTGAGTTSERMRIDSSGNVGIGTSSPSQKLSVVGNQAITGSVFHGSATNNSVLDLYSSNGGSFYVGIESSTAGGSFTGSSAYASLLVSNNAPLQFGTGNIIRATIDNSGNLLVGTTSVPYSMTAGRITAGNTGAGFYAANFYATTTSATSVVAFGNPNGVVGSISTSSTVTSYATSSDYRLKYDIQPMTGALEKIAAIKPVTYKWKADGSDSEGFIAHELAEVVPQCVTGEKDAVDAEGKPVYQGIDTSFLVATLTAAIQELKAELDAAKADIAALKGTA